MRRNRKPMRMKRGGRTKPIRRMKHGGSHRKTSRRTTTNPYQRRETSGNGRNVCQTDYPFNGPKECLQLGFEEIMFGIDEYSNQTGWNINVQGNSNGICLGDGNYGADVLSIEGTGIANLIASGVGAMINQSNPFYCTPITVYTCNNINDCPPFTGGGDDSAEGFCFCGRYQPTGWNCGGAVEGQCVVDPTHTCNSITDKSQCLSSNCDWFRRDGFIGDTNAWQTVVDTMVYGLPGFGGGTHSVASCNTNNPIFIQTQNLGNPNYCDDDGWGTVMDLSCYNYNCNSCTGGIDKSQTRRNIMRRGGKTRPLPRGRGRKFQAGGHTHDIGHAHTNQGFSAHGQWHSPNGTEPWGMHQTGSLQIQDGGSHNHPTVLPRPPRPGGVMPGMSKGGKVTHKFRRGGRTRPIRKMAHGGTHNGCPPGTHMMPDGTCMEGEVHGAMVPGESSVAYRRGGRTKPRRKMRRGRKMAHGGRTHGSCPEGMVHSPTGGCMRAGGKTGSRKKMRRGGLNKPIRRFASGGTTGCGMWTSKVDCDKNPGCNWDYNDNCCQ